MARFRKQFYKSPKTGCWIWTGTRYKEGYGKFSISGHSYRSHRLMWELENDPIPDGLNVLHTCDNPPCVNPEHLFLGTQTDNIADMKNKGRQAKGEKIAQSKVTQEDVDDIRRIYSEGYLSQKDIADVFGISNSQVSNIVRRISWQECCNGSI